MKLLLFLFLVCFLQLQILFSQDVEKDVEVGIIEHFDEFVLSIFGL